SPPRSSLRSSYPRPPGWRDADNGKTDLFGPVVKQLMLHNAWGHVYRVAGPHLLLPNLAAFGLPLDDSPPAEYEIDLLEIGGVFDFVDLSRVFCMRMPIMRAEARAHLIHVEKELFRSDDSFYLPRFLAQAAYILRLDVLGPDNS